MNDTELYCTAGMKDLIKRFDDQHEDQQAKSMVQLLKYESTTY